ncbi:MAG: riboflavin biosynthesis protein RibF, partial [Candidatus Cloacimonetes bacterium 4572_65]
HCKLLKKLREVALELNCEPLILTYANHSKDTLNKNKVPYIISTTPQKIEIFKSRGLNNIELLNFSTQLAEMSPEEFLEKELIEKFHPKAIVLGYDTHFGKDRKGNYDLVKKFEEKYNYKTYRVEPLIFEGSLVSSTIIRGLLSKGEMIAANRLLNRRFSFHGTVTQGKKIGKTLGYPTINIQTENEYQLTPPSGIYYSTSKIDNVMYNSVTNIGTNPTVSTTADIKIESFVLEFDEDVYGKNVETFFIERIREEKKFNNLEELKEAIHQDVQKIKGMINENNWLS